MTIGSDLAGGYLKAEISGRSIEAFIDRCVKNGIQLRKIVRTGETTAICYLSRPEASRLRQLLKQSDCRIRILEKKGGVFLWKQVRRQLSLLSGIVFFIAILLLLSNMVWSIRVSGADPALEEKIRTLLKKQHLYVGTLNFFIPDSGKLETMLSSRLNKVTWIGVSQEGTTYKIDVVQKKYPSERRSSGPRDLVAAKQAVIHHLFVKSGQPVVESNQFVKAGQPLVRGRIGGEKSNKFVSAAGEVVGETWYHPETQIPLTSRYTLYTGHTYQSHRLLIGSWEIPFWGFRGHPYAHSDDETQIKRIRFLLWELPISYKHVQYREKKSVLRRLNRRQAEAAAVTEAGRKLLARLPAGADIVSSTIEERGIKRNVLTIRSRQVVYENIAVPKAIDPAKEMKRSSRKPKEN